MNRIKILKAEVASKIAAGETCEKPVNAVKELVENSIDAGADKIRVEIIDGGLKYISISDNGAGIDKDDLHLTIERFATSKVVNLDDVYSASTFGFRGEALAAISSISDFSITSGTSDNNIYQLISKFGVKEDIKPSAGLKGTTIVISSLFENFPARKKFLKGIKSLESDIIKFIRSFVYLNNDIELEFIVNGKVNHSVKKDESLLEKISNHYKDKVFLEGEFSKDHVTVKVVTTDIEHSNRLRRDNIIIGVNGRVITDKSLIQAVCQAYYRIIPDGNSPISVVDIRLNPTEMDANVHPAKAEVRFKESKLIFYTVLEAVKSAINKSTFFSTIHQSISNNDDVTGIGDSSNTGNRYSNNFNNQQGMRDDTAQRFDKYTNSPTLSDHYKSTKIAYSQSNDFKAQNTSISEPHLTSNYTTTQQDSDFNSMYFDSVMINHDDNYKIIGQLFNTFILIEREGELIFIDQHIAHERLLYEKKMLDIDHKRSSIVLHIPIKVTLEEDLVAMISDDITSVTSLGYVINCISNCEIEILEVPIAFARLDISKVFIESVEEIFAKGESKHKDNRLISKSCRSAIMAGDILSIEEIRYLVDEIIRCKNNRTCPHGRPIIFKMSLAELSRKFGR